MSLRTRLAIAYLSFFTAALIALDTGLYLLVRQALLGNIDNELIGGAELLQNDFNQSNQTVLGYFNNGTLNTVLLHSPSVSQFERTNLYVQVYSGQDIVNNDYAPVSSNFPQPFPVEPSQLRTTMQDNQYIGPVDVQGVRFRELLIPLTFHHQVVGVLQVARLMKETDQALRLLFYALVGGGLVVLLAAVRGGAWLTRAAFRPIDEITRTAQSIVRAEDLSRRVPVPEAQDELHRLTVTINDMLMRMDELFSTQRRFVADVSHELRTPLAAMQGNLEVLDRGATRDPLLLAESLADMRREVNRLIRMVNDLLLLAQSDAGVILRHEPVELDTLLLEVHRELRPLAKEVQLRLGHEDQVTVPGDRDRIKQALLNLGVNALQHTPSGGSVTLSLEHLDGYASISVRDTGSGIDLDDLPLIFERFYRADHSRSRSAGGAGLGLAIVKWIAEAHGGRVEVESIVGQGSRFALVLPLGEESAQPATLQIVHQDREVRAPV